MIHYPRTELLPKAPLIDGPEEYHSHIGGSGATLKPIHPYRNGGREMAAKVIIVNITIVVTRPSDAS